MCVTVSVVSRQWDKVEDKYAVAAIGVAAIVALWTAAGALKVQGEDDLNVYLACSSIFICVQICQVENMLFLRTQAIEKLPLLPGVLEIVGIGYTGVSSKHFYLHRFCCELLLVMDMDSPFMNISGMCCCSGSHTATSSSSRTGETHCSCNPFFTLQYNLVL